MEEKLDWEEIAREVKETKLISLSSAAKEVREATERDSTGAYYDEVRRRGISATELISRKLAKLDVSMYKTSEESLAMRKEFMNPDFYKVDNPNPSMDDINAALIRVTRPFLLRGNVELPTLKNGPVVVHELKETEEGLDLIQRTVQQYLPDFKNRVQPRYTPRYFSYPYDRVVMTAIRQVSLGYDIKELRDEYRAMLSHHYYGAYGPEGQAKRLGDVIALARKSGKWVTEFNRTLFPGAQKLVVSAFVPKGERKLAFTPTYGGDARDLEINLNAQAHLKKPSPLLDQEWFSRFFRNAALWVLGPPDFFEWPEQMSLGAEATTDAPDLQVLGALIIQRQEELYGRKRYDPLEVNMNSTPGLIFHQNLKERVVHRDVIESEVNMANELMRDISQLVRSEYTSQTTNYKNFMDKWVWSRLATMKPKAEVYERPEGKDPTKVRNIFATHTFAFMPAKFIYMPIFQYSANYFDTPHTTSILGLNVMGGGMDAIMRHIIGLPLYAGQWAPLVYSDNLYIIAQVDEKRRAFYSLDGVKMEGCINPSAITRVVTAVLERYTTTGGLGGSILSKTWQFYFKEFFPRLIREMITVIGNQRVRLPFMGSGVNGTAYFNTARMNELVAMLQKLKAPIGDLIVPTVDHKWAPSALFDKIMELTGVYVTIENALVFPRHAPSTRAERRGAPATGIESYEHFFRTEGIEVVPMDLLGYDLAIFKSGDITMFLPTLARPRLLKAIAFSKSGAFGELHLGKIDKETKELVERVLRIVVFKVLYVIGGYAHTDVALVLHFAIKLTYFDLGIHEFKKAQDTNLKDLIERYMSGVQALLRESLEGEDLGISASSLMPYLTTTTIPSLDDVLEVVAPKRGYYGFGRLYTPDVLRAAFETKTYDKLYAAYFSGLDYDRHWTLPVSVDDDQPLSSVKKLTPEVVTSAYDAVKEHSGGGTPAFALPPKEVFEAHMSEFDLKTHGDLASYIKKLYYRKPVTPETFNAVYLDSKVPRMAIAGMMAQLSWLAASEAKDARLYPHVFMKDGKFTSRIPSVHFLPETADRSQLPIGGTVEGKKVIILRRKPVEKKLTPPMKGELDYEIRRRVDIATLKSASQYVKQVTEFFLDEKVLTKLKEGVVLEPWVGVPAAQQIADIKQDGPTLYARLAGALANMSKGALPTAAFLSFFKGKKTSLPKPVILRLFFRMAAVTPKAPNVDLGVFRMGKALNAQVVFKRLQTGQVPEMKKT